MRAVAAVWVLLFHFARLAIEQVPELRPLAPLMGKGYIAVDLFFVLSGFVIAHAYADVFGRRIRAEDVYSFALGRIGRIYPLHLATLLCLFAYAVVVELTGRRVPARFDWSFAWQHLLMVHSWLGARKLTWNEPSWSVSAEFFAYTLFPLAAPVVVRTRRLIPPLAGALGVSCVTALVLYMASPSTLDVTDGRALVRCAGSFLAGALLSQVPAGRLHTTRIPWFSVLAPTAGALLYVAGKIEHALLPAFVLFVFGLSRESNIVTAALSTKLLRKGGELSYALYITHGLVLTFLETLVHHLQVARGPFMLRCGAIAMELVFFVVVAWISHRRFEEPARIAVRRILDPRSWRRPCLDAAPASLRPSRRD